MKVRSRLVLILLLILALCLPTVASADAATWESVRGPAVVPAIAYGNGLYVAAQNGMAEVLLSQDGLSWTDQPIDSQAIFWTVMWTGKEFAGATEDAVWTSPDGKAWSKRFTAPVGSALYSLSIASDRIFITTKGTDTAFLLSADGGTSWQRINNVPLLSVVSLGDRFVGTAGIAPGIWSSTDGLTWQKAAGTDAFTALDVVVGADRAIAYGPSGPMTNQVWTTTDGQNWSKSEVPYRKVTSMTFYQGAFYVIGGPEGPYMRRSVDGANWAPVAYKEPDSRGGSPSYFLTAGPHLWLTGTGYLLRMAADGNWTFAMNDRLRGRWNDITWGAGYWVATGYNGQLFRSQNGRSWERIDVGITRALTYVEWVGDRFIASSENTVVGSCREPGPNETCRSWILQSKDGITWTKTAIDGPQIVGAAVSGKTIVVVDWGWDLWRSNDDGQTWTKQPRPDQLLWDDVTFHDGTFWAIAGADIFQGARTQSTLLSSVDGLTWKREGSFAPGASFDHLTWNEETLVIWGSSGILSGKPEMAKWQLTHLPTGQMGSNLRSLAFGDGYTIGVQATPNSTRSIVQYKLGGQASDQLIAVAAQAEAIAYHDGQFIAVGNTVQSLRVRPSTACVSRFVDLPADQNACKALESLAGAGVVGGFPDGTFRPTASVKRAEIAKMLVLAKGWKPEPAGALAFGDTNGHWAASLGYLQPAVGQKAITGFPDGTFQPEGTLTRAQLVKVVAAAAGRSPAGPTRYTDIAPDAWYAGWVADAEGARLIGPNAPIPLWSEGRFEGEKPATRLEAAILLYNLRQLYR